MIRVLLYTDEPVLARGLTAIARASGGHSVDVCDSTAGLPERAKAAAPCVVLIDWTHEISLDLLRRVCRESPGCAIVLWTRIVPTELAYQAIEAGVRGVLRKTAAADLVLKCLSQVAAGETWLDQSLTASFLAAKAVRLTPRESQLVTLLSQGLKNKEIAVSLSISEGTVKVYLSRLFQKLGVKDRFELALYGLRNMQGGAAGRKAEVPAPGAQPLRSILLEKSLEPAPGPFSRWNTRS